MSATGRPAAGTPTPSEAGRAPRPRPSTSDTVMGNSRPQDNWTPPSIDDDDVETGGWKPAKPDYFHGDRARFDNWSNQMLMYLYLSQVPNDKRTLVATTFLRGNAQQWMKPHLTKYLATRRDPEGMFTDYTVFQRKFKELFGISNEVAKATRDIQSVRQERSAAEYAAKFREHSNLLGWDNESLMVMYRRGLKECQRRIGTLRSHSGRREVPHTHGPNQQIHRIG